MSYLLAAAQTAQPKNTDWLTDHATLVVGVVGIIVSGFIGPSVTAWWTRRREEAKDHRALVAARREDLRTLLDETAKTLGGAVTQLRPLLLAEQNGESLPTEPAEFLGSLVPLGERLRLRLAASSAVVRQYEKAVAALRALGQATGTSADWEAAVGKFEYRRSEFLSAGREALQAPIASKTEI